MNNKVATTWGEIRAWIAKNAPLLNENLQVGASAVSISQLEQHLGVSLPEDYKTFLLLCNGENSDSASFYFGQLLSVEDVKSQWNVWKELLDDDTFAGITSEPQKGIRNDWWSPRWIPITHDGAGNHLCLDLDPIGGGVRGQIITMWHDSGERELMFGNFTEWLDFILVGLENGSIVFDADEYLALVDMTDIG
jgi:cell wall assembly regulator SMI1